MFKKASFRQQVNISGTVKIHGFEALEKRNMKNVTNLKIHVKQYLDLFAFTWFLASSNILNENGEGARIARL